MLSPAILALSSMQPMPVEECRAVSKCMAHPSSYKNSMGYNAGEASAARHALQQLEAARAKDVATHEANARALAHNAEIVKQVTGLMKGLGVPDSWQERDYKSRARSPKHITVQAGYRGDLARYVKTNDNFQGATYTYKSLLDTYQRYLRDAEIRERDQKAAAERAKRQEEEKRRADMELAKILVRYELPADSHWWQVLEALEGRDQTLRLALAMQDTRADWSEGPGRVQSALNQFQPVTVQDHQISDEVQKCLDNYDGDGRIFRDTAWNYDRLFAAVADQQLVADVQLARQRSEDERPW